MNFNIFKRKKYNSTTLPDISRINLNKFYQEFENKLLRKMAQADLNNTSYGQPYRVADVIQKSKNIALESAREAMVLAYRPKR
jgi:hypothetical protein